MSLLFVGSRGDQVLALQILLVEHGASINPDGVFGNQTEQALKAFQAGAGLAADGVAGPATLEALRIDHSPKEPVSWSDFVALFPQCSKQTYVLRGAQTPEKPSGIRLRSDLIGDKTINCTQFTTWIVASAFGATWNSDQWARWQNTGRQRPLGRVPDYGPRVAIDWGIATTAPGPGPFLVQYFTAKGGHSMLVVDHDLETDKILTLEANSSWGLDGVGWADIGNLRDVPHPGANWTKKVSQTWASRIDTKIGVHVARLRIVPNSVSDWLKPGEK